MDITLLNLSPDTFNEVALKMPMKDVWILCSSSVSLQDKCNSSGFWSKQLRLRYPGILVSENPRQQFMEIAQYLEEHGTDGTTWFVQVSTNPSATFRAGTSVCDMDLNIKTLFQIPDEEYNIPDQYQGNIFTEDDWEESWKKLNRWVYAPTTDWDIQSTVGIAKSQSTVVPGQKVWIAMAFNEDYMSHVGIFDTLDDADNYLIRIVDEYYRMELPSIRQDMINNPLDEMLALEYNLMKSNRHKSTIKTNHCWYYPSDKYPARTFRVIEHVI